MANGQEVSTLEKEELWSGELLGFLVGSRIDRHQQGSSMIISLIDGRFQRRLTSFRCRVRPVHSTSQDLQVQDFIICAQMKRSIFAAGVQLKTSRRSPTRWLDCYRMVQLSEAQEEYVPECRKSPMNPPPLLFPPFSTVQRENKPFPSSSRSCPR